MLGQTQRSSLMIKEYGRASKSIYCKGCCNLHCRKTNKNEKVCIAWGDDDTKATEWKDDATSCGLYNTAFLSLTPARKQMMDLYSSKKKVADNSNEQLTIF